MSVFKASRTPTPRGGCIPVPLALSLGRGYLWSPAFLLDSPFAWERVIRGGFELEMKLAGHFAGGRGPKNFMTAFILCPIFFIL